jgi:hypothetical protein
MRQFLWLRQPVEDENQPLSSCLENYSLKKTTESHLTALSRNSPKDPNGRPTKRARVISQIHAETQ